MKAPTKPQRPAPSRERIIEALRVLEAQGHIDGLELFEDGFTCRVPGAEDVESAKRAAVVMACAHIRRAGVPS